MNAFFQVKLPGKCAGKGQFAGAKYVRTYQNPAEHINNCLLYTSDAADE